MATYYVRISGNDANTGTSPAQAWRTIQKALGSTGIASGDTVFIGAGVYREDITISIASVSSETKIVGDPTGVYTGDPGEIIWSAYTSGDFAAPPTNRRCVTLNGKSYLTFENITFQGGASFEHIIDARINVVPSTNTTIRNCTFFNSSFTNQHHIVLTTTFGTSLNWLIENCRFANGTVVVSVTAPRGSGSDYNLNITIRNCLSIANTQLLGIASSGTGTNMGNGGLVTNCTLVGTGSGVTIVNTGTGVSTAFPVTVRNCLGLGGFLTANTLGQIVDGGGNRIPTGVSPLTNVTAHLTSRYSNFPSVGLFEIGQSAALGLPVRAPFTPYVAGSSFPAGVCGYGNVSVDTTTDILGAARPSGSSVYYDTGTATSGTTSTLVDTTKNWPTSYLVGWKIRIVAGTGSGQVKTIRTNSATSVTISGGAPAGGNWAITPDATSQYVIYQGPLVETGKATSGTTTTLVDSNANWATGQWNGYSCEFDGQSATVASNTATTLTFTATVTAPTASSTYSLYFPGSSLTANLPAAGAFEGGNTGKIDTSTYAP